MRVIIVLQEPVINHMPCVEVRIFFSSLSPSYGFLSEKPEFVTACEEAGVSFLGPTLQAMEAMSSKTAARQLAQGLNVPTVPGTVDVIKNMDEAKAFCKSCGFLVILKASFGGGGRGMRVVWYEADLPQAFERATSEALASFGDGSVFIEKYLVCSCNPRVMLSLMCH